MGAGSRGGGWRSLDKGLKRMIFFMADPFLTGLMAFALTPVLRQSSRQ